MMGVSISQNSASQAQFSSDGSKFGSETAASSSNPPAPPGGGRIPQFREHVREWATLATPEEGPGREIAAYRIEQFLKAVLDNNETASSLALNNLGLSSLPNDFKLLGQICKLKKIPDIEGVIDLRGNPLELTSLQRTDLSNSAGKRIALDPLPGPSVASPVSTNCEDWSPRELDLMAQLTQSNFLPAFNAAARGLNVQQTQLKNNLNAKADELNLQIERVNRASNKCGIAEVLTPLNIHAEAEVIHNLELLHYFQLAVQEVRRQVTSSKPFALTATKKTELVARALLRIDELKSNMDALSEQLDRIDESSKLRRNANQKLEDLVVLTQDIIDEGGQFKKPEHQELVKLLKQTQNRFQQCDQLMQSMRNQETLNAASQGDAGSALDPISKHLELLVILKYLRPSNLSESQTKFGLNKLQGLLLEFKPTKLIQELLDAHPNARVVENVRNCLQREPSIDHSDYLQIQNKDESQASTSVSREGAIEFRETQAIERQGEAQQPDNCLIANDSSFAPTELKKYPFSPLDLASVPDEPASQPVRVLKETNSANNAPRTQTRQNASLPVVSEVVSPSPANPTLAAKRYQSLFEPTAELINLIGHWQGCTRRVIELVKNHYQPLQNQLQPAELDAHRGLFDLCKELGANEDQIREIAAFLMPAGQIPEGSRALMPDPGRHALNDWMARHLQSKIIALRSLRQDFNRFLVDYNPELLQELVLADLPENHVLGLSNTLPLNLMRALAEDHPSLEELERQPAEMDDTQWRGFHAQFSALLDETSADTVNEDYAIRCLTLLNQRIVNRLLSVWNSIADEDKAIGVKVFECMSQVDQALLRGLFAVPARGPMDLNFRQVQLNGLFNAVEPIIKLFEEEVSSLPDGDSKTRLSGNFLLNFQDLAQTNQSLVNKLPDFLATRLPNANSAWIRERPTTPGTSPEVIRRYDELDQARNHWKGTFADLGLDFKAYATLRPSKPVDYLETLDNTQVISWAENLLKQPIAELDSAKAEMVLEALALKGLLLARKVHGPLNVALHHQTLVGYQDKLNKLLSEVASSTGSAGEALLKQPAFVYTDSNVLGAHAQSTLSDGLLKMMSNDFKSSVRGQRACPTYKVILENLLSTEPGQSSRSIVGDISIALEQNALTDPVKLLLQSSVDLTDEDLRFDWSKLFLKSAFEGVKYYKGTIAPYLARMDRSAEISKLRKTEFKSLSGFQNFVLHHALTEVSFAQDTPDHMLESLVHSALIADGFDLNDVYAAQARAALKCRSFEEKAMDDKRSMFALTRQKTLHKQANVVGAQLSKSFENKLKKLINEKPYFETQLDAVLNHQHSDHIGVRKLVHQLIVAIPTDVRRAHFQEISVLLKVANQLGTGDWGDYGQRKGDLKSLLLGLYRGTLATPPLGEAAQSAKEKCLDVFVAEINQMCANRHDLSSGLKLQSSKNKALQAEFELNRESMALRFYQTGFPILDEQERESHVSMADLLAEARQPARWPIMFHKLLLPATRVELEGGKAIAVGDRAPLSAAFSQIDEKTGTKPELNAELKAMALARALADGVCGQFHRPRSTEKDVDGKRIKSMGIQFDNQEALVNSPAAQTPLLRAVQATLQWANDAVKRSFSGHPSTERGYELEPDEVLLKALDPHGLSKPLGLYKLAEESLKAAEAAAAVGAPALVDPPATGVGAATQAIKDETDEEIVYVPARLRPRE